MVAIELDQDDQQRLDKLAESQGQDGASLARQIVLDYLDFQALAGDSDAAWAEASVALTPEIMEPENWEDVNHGP